ncbi:superoxide dismutase [Fe] [Candidatus Uhrbacteria bacterium CG10_big_fil_rev_8_21_14_0_10_50_16]|uniref:Superoxide dismutase n=1 Tax=Candidatus Uhrbacteria bacterium CG10_big_fil_rev_8_21_14_0_10_50_16 TaxID=1975039 RepID=A0A2H0RMM7_9BACT|nr:MAG: superoxide dismutase [Fe] [Candidatus Uhrbacteria bacterium CG10_big_fil_rev_8_21_14_0_10_50_16]
MAFQLLELPFDSSAFADFTSANTFSFHHGKHHAGYVNKLNAAIEGSAYEGMPLNEVIRTSRESSDLAVFNNAAQHANHCFFWNCLSAEVQVLSGEIKEMIDRDFESVEIFTKQFSDAAMKLFGSGWVWLVKTEDETLEIRSYKDAETPIASDATPLLTLDVWEHAYYLDYQNNRAGFIEGFWNHVNWEFVARQ